MRVLLALTLFLYSITLVFSQESLVSPIVPLTPNAASLGKFGDIPIGLYTGQPNISIPLYQIDYPNLSVPITLVYNYNGLKVEEYPGWVGTGWTLTGTGVINRQQRSLPDESLNGYNGQYRNGEKVQAFINTGMYEFTGPDLENGSTPWFDTGFTDWLAAPANEEHLNLLTAIKNRFADSEPDMFIFNIPGASGKFFFDHTQCGATEKNAIVLPHQNIQVVGTFNYGQSYPASQTAGVISKFEIIDGKGNHFLFSQLEQSTVERENVDNGSPDYDGFNNTWYLSKITDVYGNEITYQYTARTIDTPPTVREEVIIPFEALDGRKVAYQAKSTEAVLEQITFRNGSLEFVEEENPRLDWNSTSWMPGTTSEQPKALAAIKVLHDGILAKEFDFSYGYFGTSARLRLDNVRERSGGLVKPPFEFYYKEIADFPRIGDEHSLFSQDHWGYYTGAINNTLIPPFRYSSALLNVTMVRNGNDRTPNPAFASAGILTRIKYPTGGFTSFEYEANEYHSLFVEQPADFNPCAGQFVSYGEVSENLRGDVNGEEEQMYAFTISSDICAKVEVLVDVSGCEESLAYVLLRSAVGELYISARMNSDRSFTYEEGIFNPLETFILPAGNYELVAGVINAAVSCPQPYRSNQASISLSIVSQDPAEADFTRIAGGMRVAKVVDCASSPCSGCTTKYFDYSDPNDPDLTSGRLITGPNYVYRQRFLVGNGYSTPVVPGEVLSAHSSVPVVGTQGSTVGYKYVTVREDAQDLKGSAVHHYTSANEYPDEGSLRYPFPPRIDSDWKRGAELTTSFFRSTDSSSELVTINENSYGFEPAFNNSDKPIGLKLGNRIVSLDFEENGNPLYYYIFDAYRIESGWRKLVEQKNTTIQEGREVQTISQYTYDNEINLLPTSVSVESSEDLTVLRTMKYKDDLSSIQGLTAGEIAGIGALPDRTAVIEEQLFRGGLPVSKKLSLYSGPNLVSVRQSNGSFPLEEKVTISGYDANGNMLGYSTQSGTKKSYLYGYANRYPIAEAVNANQEEIYTNSFEESGIYAAQVAGMDHAKSGEKVSQGGSFTITDFSPSNPANLVMSFWFWNGSEWVFSGEIPFSPLISSGGTHLDEVRVYPVGAAMSTFSYWPGVGMLSKTDLNGITTYFEYDALGRVSVVRDDQYNVVTGHNYFYKD